MTTATRVRDLNWDTDAALYRLDPPIGLTSTGATYRHVVVSTLAPVEGDHGSLVFAANEAGDVQSWDPITKSTHEDHAAVLAELGFEVAP